jgi:hypothetical protein
LPCAFFGNSSEDAAARVPDVSVRERIVRQYAGGRLLSPGTIKVYGAAIRDLHRLINKGCQRRTEMAPQPTEAG